MPDLTRRHSPERQDCWHIYYDDVQAGTIAIRRQPKTYRPLAVVLRLLPRQSSGRAYGRDSGNIRESPRRF